MKILISALEPSANIHLKEVLKHTHDITPIGIFDKTLGTPMYDVSQMAVMGISDVIKKIFWFRKVLEEMVELAHDAQKVLLMDSSGFNLPLAKKLKQRYPNKEIVYYILPQVWASRPKRVKKIEAYCDKLLAILPFETSWYPSGKAQYVGHPLLDEIEATNQNKKGTIAFMPGSRKSEIEALLPVFTKIKDKLPEKKSLLVVPASFDKAKIEAWYKDIEGFEIVQDTQQALAQSEFAFICSGTATLEAALIGTPFVLSYIAKPLDFFIGTKILKIKQIGLANILLTHHNQSSLHQEIIQGDVTPENLIKIYKETDYEIFRQNAKILREYLSHGSSVNVANILMER